MKSAMSLAIEEAYRGLKNRDGGPFGAVIVKEDRVLASEHNTVLRDNDPTRHAELKAISRAAAELGTYDLSGCTVFSTTEPCPMCFAALHWARADKVMYGTRIADVRQLGFNELTVPSEKMKELGGSPVAIEAGFMREECLKLLEYWKELPDRVTY